MVKNEAEHGNPIADNKSSLRNKSYFAYKNINSIYLGGSSLNDLHKKHNIKKKDLDIFMPAKYDDIDKKIEVHYLGYYLNWIPQETYYYAVENCGFIPRPFRLKALIQNIIV